MFLARQDVIIENIADEVAERIITGRLEGGARLPEIPLANSLGVSRGSMREALLFLAHFHLTETSPNCGARVVPFDSDEISYFFSMWEVVLGKAVEDLAATWKRSDLDRLERIRKKLNKLDLDRSTERACLVFFRDFLIEIHSATHNPFLRKSLETLIATSLRAAHVVLSGKDKKGFELLLGMVSAVMECVSSRNHSAAYEVVRKNLEEFANLCQHKNDERNERESEAYYLDEEDGYEEDEDDDEEDD